MEEYAYVLEYLPSGRSMDSKLESIVQLVGHKFFTLLEATVKPNASIVLGKRVYVGKSDRADIDRIKRKITYDDLTTSAKEALIPVIRKLMGDREDEFIKFMNKAGPISIRVHTLDLLPGIGKKHMAIILKERDKEPFVSFDDLKERVPGVDIISVLINRIIAEMKGDERHNLFIMKERK